MVKRIQLALAALFAALSLSAQNYKVSVKLQDASNGEAVGFATVSLTPEKGNPKYALTDGEGNATVDKVKKGSYTFKAELLGYQTYTKEVSVTKDTDLGTVKMELDSKVLDAASVSAVGNPIIIKKDTVEYNASSYKISEDNMLVDLLKKLPGIEVDTDGTITSNGETISKITIAGKTFFLDDPQLASQNIPAKLVEKVKVIKKKSEQAEFTGIDDGEEETVIDLTVQKGMMNGVFGNVSGGGGHDLPSDAQGMNDWRYQGAGMVGRFAEDSQISIILNGNNTNNRGFNDMTSSMMSSLGGGGFGRGGGGFGRGQSGITTSWMAGLNGNVDLFDDKMDLGGNYLYNGSNRAVIEDSYKETYQTDGSTLVYDNDGMSNNNTYGHRFGMRLEHKFSENTSILFQPQVSFGGGDYIQTQQFNTDLVDTDGSESLKNQGFSNATGDNKNVSTNGFFLFRQRLGMPGRTISFNGTWNYSNNSMAGYNQSLTQTPNSETGTMDDTFVNQRIEQLSRSASLGGRLVYTEPLGNNFYLEGSYEYRWSQNTTNKDTWDSGANTYSWNSTESIINYDQLNETYNTSYSNEIVNRYNNQTIGLAFMYQLDKLRAQLGISALPTNTYNYTNGTEYKDENRWNWAPRAMLFYDFTENSNVRLFYFGRSAQPSTSQLMPVLDNSNPLLLSLGNPYLTPYFTHSLRSDLEYSNKQTFFTMRLHVEGGYNQDPIVSAVWYDLNARQYTFPVNGKDTYNGNVRLVVNAPIAKSGFTLSNTLNARYSRTGSYIGQANLDMSPYMTGDTFDYEKFHTDYPDLGASGDFLDNITQTLTFVERFRASYRSDNVEVMAGARTRVTKPWYTLETATANTTMANQIDGSFKWTVGTSGFELSTDADYNWYYGYTTTVDPQFIWNASISKLILHNMATIALKAYDILDQSRNFSVTDSSNYHQETYNNTLGRYIMLSFTLRFGNFGKAGQNFRNRMGGGPGGGRPMGPPPGGRF